LSYTVESESSETFDNERYSKKYFLKKMDSLSYYGEDMNEIRISVEKKGSGMMRIKMEDRQNERYEG
jgi:hypothetical protein